MSWRARLPVHALGVAASIGSVLLAAGCGPAFTADRGSASGVTAAQVDAYVAQVESVRLSVNDLLEGADPILEAYRSHEITPDEASRRMGDLEAQFAIQLTNVEAIAPPQPTLEMIHGPYAHTYLLEDSYLSALTASLPHGDFEGLPDTQNEQRQAIIEWRTQLEVLARQTGAVLPDDLQQAGRGEIAPSPTES
jgi:hypothetical protein